MSNPWEAPKTNKKQETVPGPTNESVEAKQPIHTPLELMRFAEFMASKYELTSDTKERDVQYKNENREKFLKISRVLALYIDDNFTDYHGLVAAMEKNIKEAEAAYEKVGSNEKSDLVAEERIEEPYLALEFVRTNMKNPSLGKDFEAWLKSHG